MRTIAIFGARPWIFRNLWCIRTDKGRESIFCDFVQTFFMDGPLLWSIAQTDANRLLQSMNNSVVNPRYIQHLHQYLQGLGKYI